MTASRRKFLQQFSALTAGAGVASLPLMASADTGARKKRHSAADRVRVALIGANSMGWVDLTSMLKNENVECVALCDIDDAVLARRIPDIEKRNGKKPLVVKDYRRLLDNKDIDAVVIGTPDHWHCLQMVHACEAGKDVYVEKPIGNSIEECNLMVAAKNRYNRVVQVGQWQRSDPHWHDALDYVKSGKLGHVRYARTWACVSYGRNFDPKPNAPVPQGVDYDMWLGPAPLRPFNPYRFHGTFRYFWDYAGGLMTDWGVHMIDMVLAGMNVTTPTAVDAIGGKFGYPDSAIETPDTLHTIFDFGNFAMAWEQSLGTGREPYNRDVSNPGASFTGNDATLVINREDWDVLPETEEGKFLVEALPTRHNHNNGVDLHTKNFIECIRSRKQPNCTIEMGRNAAVTAQLGNIAYRTRSRVVWNDQKNQLSGTPEAQALAKANYRKPWQLPKI